jgi:hypothetical protein
LPKWFLVIRSGAKVDFVPYGTHNLFTPAVFLRSLTRKCTGPCAGSARRILLSISPCCRRRLTELLNFVVFLLCSRDYNCSGLQKYSSLLRAIATTAAMRKRKRGATSISRETPATPSPEKLAGKRVRTLPSPPVARVL